MIKKSVIVLFTLLIISSTLGAQKKVKPRHLEPIPPVQLLPCPDIAVALFESKLESTQLGDKASEFPMDTVRLRVELESVGNVPVPTGATLHIVFQKNDEVIRTVDPANALGAKGSRWAMGVSDTFPHGQKTTYSIQVTSSIQECSVRNNRAAIDIDETRLHPGGAPDLTCSIFLVEKNWRQQGGVFKGFCTLSADVRNIGAGYCDNNSQKLILRFIKKPGDSLLYGIPIEERDLPGPGAQKRYSIEVADGTLPFGYYEVRAYIDQARNEPGGWRTNNWSSNSGRLNNAEEQPALASVRFEAFRVAGSRLHVSLRMINPQTVSLSNLRLILLKDNQVQEQWPSLNIEGRSGVSISHVEELTRPDVVFGSIPYKAILTTHSGTGLPPGNTVLAEQVRSLKWAQISETMLQNSLQDKETGIGAETREKNPNIRIHDDKTQAKITAGGFFVSVKGKFIIDNFPDVSFGANIILKPRLVGGKVELDTMHTDVQITSKWLVALTTVLLPGINLVIKKEVEKFANKLMGGQVAESAEENSAQFGSPIGLFLHQGAMDLYY